MSEISLSRLKICLEYVVRRDERNADGAYHTIFTSLTFHMLPR